MPLSRREVLKGAAVLGSMTSVSGAINGTPSASAATPIGVTSPKSITSANYFDLSAKTTASFAAPGYLKGLHPAQSHYQVQGLAFDSVNSAFFVAQTPNPDPLRLTLRMDGQAWSADSYDPHSSGDLVFSRFSLATGKITGSAYLMGAGHGGQIAVEPGGAFPYLWSEIYPGNPKGSDRKVYGTRIGRLPYISGGLITNTENVLGKRNQAPYTVGRWLPVAGSHQYSATIDTSIASGAPNGSLIVRFRLNADPPGAPKHLVAYDLAAARVGDFSTPLAATTEPIEITRSEGFAVCGQYLYLVGTDSAGNSSLYQVDFNGVPGTYLAKVGLPGNGEPESVALYAPNGIPARLYYLSAGTSRPRTFELYSLDS
jgi:hypothetical protein